MTDPRDVIVWPPGEVEDVYVLRLRDDREGYVASPVRRPVLWRSTEFWAYVFLGAGMLVVLWLLWGILSDIELVKSDPCLACEGTGRVVSPVISVGLPVLDENGSVLVGVPVQNLSGGGFNG